MNKIHIDKENIMTKLVSNQFYDSWHVFMRELLQNAFDACNTKQALEWSWGTEFLEIETAESLKTIREPFKCEIIISYDSSSRVLSIEDNGIGINENDLVNYVAKKGESFYNSEVFKEQRLKYQPISRHGIGLISCFMVSRAILIESKKDHAVNTAWNVSDPQQLEPIVAKWFENSTEIEYTTSKRTKPGTKVSLPLKTEYAKRIDMDFLVESVLHYTMYQPIPITIICDGETRTISQPKPSWDMPYLNVLGITAIQIDNEYLEGYMVLFNSRHKHVSIKSELYQQNILVTEYVDDLELKPMWLSNFAFYLNIKQRILNMNLPRTTAARDEGLVNLREQIGKAIINQFSNNPMVLGQYMAEGIDNIFSNFEAENEFVSRIVQIGVYIKGKEVQIPVRTFLKGFDGQKIRVAIISQSLFHYYRSSYPHDFKRFLNGYDAVVFDKNMPYFMQFVLPCVSVKRYIIGETPGIIYTELQLDMNMKKKHAIFSNRPDIYPEGCDEPSVFCFVANERKSPFEVVINPYNRNAQLLIRANSHIKVRNLQTMIIENIKQRIKMAQNRGLDKLIDYGGQIIDEWNSDKDLSIQSIWCLEKDFAFKINQLVAQRLTPQELAKYGLTSLYFTEEDFISWWLPPQR